MKCVSLFAFSVYQYGNSHKVTSYWTGNDLMNKDDQQHTMHTANCSYISQISGVTMHQNNNVL